MTRVLKHNNVLITSHNYIMLHDCRLQIYHWGITPPCQSGDLAVCRRLTIYFNWVSQGDGSEVTIHGRHLPRVVFEPKVRLKTRFPAFFKSLSQKAVELLNTTQMNFTFLCSFPWIYAWKTEWSNKLSRFYLSYIHDLFNIFNSIYSLISNKLSRL